MINAGDLRCPIIITSNSAEPDATPNWANVCNTWAKIAPLTSKEVYALGSGFTEEATHKVTIRYRDNIIRGMRITHRQYTFTVQLVTDPDMKRAQLDLICLEVTP